jgi:hypothetical protein
VSDTDQHAQLDRAVQAFDLIHTERGWGGPSALLRIRGGLDPEAGAELAVRPLDGHPARTLLGFSAPIGWTAIGLSTEGWVGHYEGKPTGYTTKAAAGDARQRVRVIHLLDRDGTSAGRLHWQDGRVLDEPPGEGLVVDCLRRAMGLCTPPPTDATDLLFATLWLEAIVAVGRRGSRTMTWHQAVGLHPAMQLVEEDGQGPGSNNLVMTARALGRACDWTRVRDLAIRGWKVGVEASLAVWMDTGMLSRWLLDQRPPVNDLIAGVRRRCTPATMRRITEALTELGVTTAPAGAGHHDCPGAA